MPDLTPADAIIGYVVQYQTRKFGLWYDNIHWHVSRGEAQQWIDEQRAVAEQYGLNKLNYRIKPKKGPLWMKAKQ